jgi:NAD(P)-dependent dehydrogenase (short-subunit alcohol dehydrogenase family)
VAAIEKEGGTAVALRLDIGRTETFPAFRDQVVTALRDTWQRDTFDHLVNNAGFGGMAMFPDTTEELFDRFMRVLLKGPYFVTQTLLPLLADGGAIVNVSSNSALPTGLVDAGFSAYATMKGGLNTLTRYLAKELAVRGIRVNAVSPGPTRTRLADASGVVGFDAFPEVIPALAAKTALGRIGEPDDIAAVIVGLLGDEGRWVTAQNIEVSGGYDL